MTQYVVVSESDDGAHFCLGIFNNYKTAIGEIMEHIWDFKESYKDEGDMFEITDPYDMEGEGGWCITITYKSKHWEHEPCKEHYMVLYHTVEDGKEN